MQYPHVFLLTAAAFSLIAAYFSIPWTLAGANITLLCLVLAWVLGGAWRQHWEVARDNAVTFPLLALYGLILLGALYTTALARGTRPLAQVRQAAAHGDGHLVDGAR